MSLTQYDQEERIPPGGERVALRADQGDPKSQYELGLILYRASLVARDDVTAVQWILLAVDSGHPEARRLLQEMELLLNPDHVAEARKRARAFKFSSGSVSTEQNN